MVNRITTDDLLSSASLFKSTYSLQAAFEADPSRVERFTFRAPHMLADLSKNIWDATIQAQLCQWARDADVEGRRAAMWAGEPINHTEGRAVEHVRLRQQDAAGAWTLSIDWLDLVESLRQSGRWTDVVHLGVGGSALGPELALQALASTATVGVLGRMQVHVVGNIDGHEIEQLQARLNPETTLFVVVSKSWSTLETRLNAQLFLQWMAAMGRGNWAEQAVAITAYPAKAQADGYRKVVGMPVTVGGRFSLWSAVGFSVALALGRQAFEALLRGAKTMDTHFVQTPLEHNLPVQLALLDVWYATFMQWPTRCVVPYHHGLRRLPAYLQQLEMESNGKRVGHDGSPLPHTTAPVTWGDVGASSQHSFFQWLHQGTQPTPVEFVLVAKASHPWPDHQRWLNANPLAQAQALMMGRTAGPNQRSGHQDYPGNRPSTLLVLDEMSPQALGALLAMAEHRTFVSGVMWSVNSFDQWGVELGKQLANRIESALATGNTEGLDPSTTQMVRWLRDGQTAAMQIMLDSPLHDL